MNLVNMEQAVEIIKNDGLLIYPTETFFGLGCKISSESAITKIFMVKKRLLAMPLPVIAADFEQIKSITNLSNSLQEDIKKIAEHFWPGPLSLILPARATVSPLLTGGTKKIAIRQSSHPIAHELVQKIGEPLVSSSANISGSAPSTKISDMNVEFLKNIGAVLDLPPEPGGNLASTIIEPKGEGNFTILRQGAINSNEIVKLGFNLV